MFFMNRLDKHFQINKKDLLYTDKAIWLLVIPIILEQFLNSFMGLADTVMVSNVGSVAVSAVSLVDAVNNLVVMVFSALAAGATIVCSQFLGKEDEEGANNAARQIFLSVLVISIAISLFCILTRKPLLRLIFGSVEDAIMEDALTYFLITALSYPFLALANSGSSLFRAMDNSRFPLIVSVLSNLVNMIANLILIFPFHMGVAGAALGTLIARMVNVVILYIALAKKGKSITLNHYFSIRPDYPLIFLVLSIGIPSGIENGMFQFGKLVIQSSVSTLGTTAIAAQAIAIVLELLSSQGGIGIGIGLMTMVGQAIGAGRPNEAKYYIIKGTIFGELAIIIITLGVFALAKPIIILSKMEPESATLCFNIAIFITITKILFWVPAFITPYGMRAAGDVKFSMITSTICMWGCRVILSIILIRIFHLGLFSVWIGMSTDWLVRGIVFLLRYRSGRWLKERLV